MSTGRSSEIEALLRSLQEEYRQIQSSCKHANTTHRSKDTVMAYEHTVYCDDCGYCLEAVWGSNLFCEKCLNATLHK